MKTVMVRYKTTEAQSAENESLVAAVFGELRAQAPEGLRYACYRLADGVSFVHIATLEIPGDNPLTSLPTFQLFQAQLKARCVELPVVTELSVVASYASLGAA